jgi:RIO-like serine/threonine protein kinase
MARLLRDEDVSSGRVLRALYDLRGDSEPVPASSIAQNLRCTDERVLEHLRNLKNQRIVRDCRRKGARVWTTWSLR